MDTDKAQIIIKELFQQLGLGLESVSCSTHEKRGHIFSILSADLERLSADRPDIIRDLAYLLKRLFNKGSKAGEEPFKCAIDINNQQSKTDEKIKEKALAAAREARNQKSDVILEPMSSYERMVIHSALVNDPDITTESVGEGKERRVKIKYLAV